MKFNWDTAPTTLKDFGGSPVHLTIHKTGMPFFDALRLYGVIDLYVGLREDVFIHDSGYAWEIRGRARRRRLVERDTKAVRQVLDRWSRKKPAPEVYCPKLLASLEQGQPLPTDVTGPATKGLKGLDAALQAGIRDTAAASYHTLQSGQASPSTCCMVKIPLSDASLAFAGQKRVEGRRRSILFLPVFEGQIDLSKVVSPLHLWLSGPNVTCAQVMALLALRTSLFSEGYEDRLTAVVFNTAFGSRERDNCSGMISVASTAIGRIKAADFANHLYRVFRALVGKAWERRRATSFVPDALAMAYWLMHPLPKHLSSFITSQERLRRDQGWRTQAFVSRDYVKEVFEMTIGSWQGDHEAVRKFGKAVASGIYYARMVPAKKRGDDAQKAWYDEVTMLRSASSWKAFREKAQILIEQGHREHSQVGTTHRDEAFDPSALLASLGKDRSSFEEFRDLFRMYLVQESTYQVREKEPEDGGETETAEESADENGKEEAE